MIFPIRCGLKPGKEGVHAEAAGPSPQEQATFLVGGDSVHMSVGTVPHYFPSLPVITIRPETAKQEDPRMLHGAHMVPASEPQSHSFDYADHMGMVIQISLLLFSFSTASWSVVPGQPQVEQALFTLTPPLGRVL